MWAEILPPHPCGCANYVWRFLPHYISIYWIAIIYVSMLLTIAALVCKADFGTVAVAVARHYKGALPEWKTAMKILGTIYLTMLLLVLLALSGSHAHAGGVPSSSSPQPPQPSPSSAGSSPVTTRTSQALDVWLEPGGDEPCAPPSEGMVEDEHGKLIKARTSGCKAGRKAFDWKPGVDRTYTFTTPLGRSIGATRVHVNQ